jgi:DNA transformation protein
MTGSRNDAEHVIELLGPTSGVELRRFFGGWSLIHAGTQIGIVMDTVYAKVDEPLRGHWRDEGCHPFRYESRGRTVTVEAYWTVPPDALDNAELLRHLLLDPTHPLPTRADHDDIH